MRTIHKRRGRPGYISYVMVVITAAFLTTLMFYAYKRASATQAVQGQVQLRIDYSEKEDAVLRSIIAIAPNRAMRAMQNSSAVAGTNRDSLAWQSIFNDAVTQANARSSTTEEVRKLVGGASALSGNTGDSTRAVTTNLMFTNVHGGANTVYVTSGLNRAASSGLPAALTSANSTVNTNDVTYPIISNDKVSSGSSKYAVLKYPEINFGYANPGDDFVAKRNWWAFSMDLAGNDRTLTGSATARRQFVLSIYEVPSQLSISAPSFMSIGKFANGNWQNVSIDGNIFASDAQVEGNFSPTKLASRRGMTFASGSTVGGQSFSSNPFTPGLREKYEVDNGVNSFFPVSMPSESGRSVFIPINRGNDFFDWYANDTETSTLSTTTWNNYSSGALQCAMRLDVTKVVSATNKTPSEFTFSYTKNGNKVALAMPPIQGNTNVRPTGYDIKYQYSSANPTANSVTIDNVYYPGGVDATFYNGSQYYFKLGVTSGSVTFSPSSFSCPTGTASSYKGYFRARQPFNTISGPGGKICIAVYPKCLPAFLRDISANTVTMSDNHSIVVNSDWKGGANIVRPSTTVPLLESDYGVVLDQCDDLTKFTKGFSLVTNFRLYIASDFNTVPKSGTTYPPCSLFAPEKRYGLDSNPYSVSMTGQVGSLATDVKGNGTNPSRPLDAIAKDGTALTPDRITVNLKPIKEVDALPPITMMNWLVLIEERRSEYW